MKKNYTAGPWGIVAGVIVSDNGSIINQSLYTEAKKQEQEFNLKLMAASVSLYENCKEILKLREEMKNTEDMEEKRPIIDAYIFRMREIENIIFKMEL